MELGQVNWEGEDPDGLVRPARVFWRMRVLAGLAATILTGLGVGCGSPNTYVEPPPPEVTVALPVRQDVTDYFETTGTTQPVRTIDVRARVKGFLKERHFKEGAMVKAGQLLFVIDEEPFQLALEQAKTRLAEAEAALKKAKESKARETATAQLSLGEAQLRLAEISQTRQRTLAARNAASSEERDQADAAQRKAEAQVDSDRAQLEQALADYDTNILSAEAGVAAARTAIRNAEIELGYCRMTATIDGRISRVNYHVGNLVGDGQSSLLATIVKTDPVFAYMTISEYDLGEFRIQPAGGSEDPDLTDSVPPDPHSTPVEMELAGETGFPHRGYIDYQDPGLDPGTGTVNIRGVFANPGGRIMPGLFVRLRIPFGERKGALLVPERALGTDQFGQYLLVVGADDVVEYRTVKAGPLVGGLRVVEGAIDGDDRVVVDGLLRARPKLKVKPKVQEAAAAVASGEASPRR